MTSIMEHITRTFGITDAADIALVALFLYALLMWARSTASRQIVLGIGVFAVVYVVAREFDLYMTTVIFQAMLTFAAIAVIVVFQEDLRRAFSNLASLGRLARSRSVSADEPADIIVEMVFQLAKKRVGALVALCGVEPIERHVHGGVVTDARISKALLDSIFDPHSLGHDGAVIVDRGRISQFGARLPLSDNSDEIAGRGTRHSAALGLSQLSDALVLVVSEERGEVSIAENGRLTTIGTPAELKQHLDRFDRRVEPARYEGRSRRWIVENFGLKLTALVIACVAWFTISSDAETVHKTFVVPIEYRNLSDAMEIDDAAPSEARLTLTGYERAFGLFSPGTLKVSLDLSKIGEGAHEITIDETHVKLPSNLTLFRAAPRVVSFEAYAWTKARVAVQLQTTGRLRRELRQREVKASPDALQVSVWRSMKSEATTIATEPIDLAALSDDVEIKAKLVLPQHMRIEPGQPADVIVKLEPVSP